jgi:hypothetical protein
MQHQCSLIGVDRRINQHTSEVATLHEQQKFYTTWDSSALRLTWTGADWSQDGDLFIYLDTELGGTNRLYNPYTDTVDSSRLYLPGVTPFDASQTGGEADERPINGRTELRRAVIGRGQQEPMRNGYLHKIPIWVSIREKRKKGKKGKEGKEGKEV